MAAAIADNRDEFGYLRLNEGWTETYEHFDTDDEFSSYPNGRNTWPSMIEHVDTDDELFFPEDRRPDDDLLHQSRKPQVLEQQRLASSREASSIEICEDVAGETHAVTSDDTAGRERRAPAASHSAARDHHDTDRVQEQRGLYINPQTASRSEVHRIASSLERQYWREFSTESEAGDSEDDYSDGTFSDWDESGSDISDDSFDRLLVNQIGISMIDLNVDCPIVEDGEPVICSICLDECPGAQGDTRTVAKCGHKFHAECLETWLKRHAQCPNCRCYVSRLSTPSSV